ncbi:serine hydrolase [Methylobacterium sp. sgz302541]|uniref:serine hydrolase n=1 Tax=unclassified Methylobacterium TaxID=2615210 RepID=UPI003D357292
MGQGRFAACLAVLLLALPLPGTTRAAPAESPAPYAQRAAALIEPYLEAGLFSGAILVARDGKPIFRRAYGLANREWGIPNGLDTRFRIASLTKAFTAAAILQLAEAGKLGLDDPVRRFVPDAPAIWERVTLRHLLQHSSGIINYTALPSYLPKLSRIEQSPSEIVALTTAEPLLFEPGTRFEYSNTNYVLLGMTVEAASGLPYARYLRERLIGPLGLKDTDYDDVSAILPRRASGYRRGQAQWRNAAPTASSVPYAAGGLYSTVDDLAAWIRALLSDKLLSPASREAMFTDGGFGYGLGWFVGKGNERRLWSHGGSIPGYLAMADIYPDERLSVIVLANTETAPAQKMARELAALQFGTLDRPEAIVLEDVILDRYVGTYRVGPRYFLTIARDGGRLIARGTGEAPYPFLPESDRTFFSPVVDSRITFETEPDGSRTGLVLHRAGHDWTAPPVDAEEERRVLSEPPKEHREIALDRAALARQLGRYALAPGVVLTIGLSPRGQPYAQATGQARNAIYAEGPGAYFMKTLDAQISFAADASGRVTGLVLRQNGLDTPAPRLGGEEAAPKRR